MFSFRINWQLLLPATAEGTQSVGTEAAACVPAPQPVCVYLALTENSAFCQCICAVTHILQ